MTKHQRRDKEFSAESHRKKINEHSRPLKACALAFFSRYREVSTPITAWQSGDIG
jgi:hypothetical protein